LNNEEGKINVYPNPTSNILNIEVQDKTELSITNMMGEIVKTQTINGFSTVDVSKLNDGIYFIRYLNSGKVIKFIKE